MKNDLTKHHQICQNAKSYKWEKWLKGSNYHTNIIMLKDLTHRSFHNIFMNNDFRWQVETLLEINSTSLTEYIKSDVIKILNCKELDYFFNKQCYKK